MEDIRAHLRNLEEALLDPAVRHDRSKVDALLAPDFQEFGSLGRVWTRNATLDLLASESYFRPAIEDFHCATIAEGVRWLHIARCALWPVRGLAQRAFAAHFGRSKTARGFCASTKGRA